MYCLLQDSFLCFPPGKQYVESWRTKKKVFCLFVFVYLIPCVRFYNCIALVTNVLFHSSQPPEAVPQHWMTYENKGQRNACAIRGRSCMIAGATVWRCSNVYKGVQ